MKQILIVAMLGLIISCSQKPYVEHELKASKSAGDCSVVPATFKLISNIGGERFEFSKCLPADFDKKQVKVTRVGDTVVVKFPAPANNGAVYALTLDIDSYPKYSYLMVDDEIVTLGQTEN